MKISKLACILLSSIAWAFILPPTAFAQIGQSNVSVANVSAPDQTAGFYNRQNMLSPSPSNMNMVTINPGQSILGSPPYEQKRDNSEGPLQPVSIGYSFEVGKFEVTFAEWDKCVAGGGCAGHRPKDGNWGRGKRPVINVSWNDTQKYIKWLNRKTGLKYRLLSEAEWEYIARAGSNTPFATGGMITTQQANFNGQESYAGSPLGNYRRKTVPVGSFGANAYGLHDLHGNVWEWTQDCWSPNHSGNRRDGSPTEKSNCKHRVMKGGSWVNKPDDIRIAQRQQYVPDYRYDDYGFRIARTLSK